MCRGWVSEPRLPGVVDETRDLPPHLQGVLRETSYHGGTQWGHSPPDGRAQGVRGRKGEGLPPGSPSSPHLTDPRCLGLSTSSGKDAGVFSGRCITRREILSSVCSEASLVCVPVCVHGEGHAYCLHLLMEDSRPSPGSAVNGFYKQLLIKKRLSSKQFMFLKELMHFPMRTVLFNINP